ncbi:FAM72 protein-domain-containing protein [Roridomyces roridus]|uniref:FAM72 protein-domain-containing protein n=1 Tax=Roridomyces roridus TaxID=1738132 RepID=A0AAD7FWQ7_9AGAR|nr:FAM72 protein-domain-containing protein [Roridomyces roridus]
MTPTPSYFNPWHLFPPYTHQPIPPPVTHKVFILDCKSCGTFLTNRGMKAVLLLRPNVALYSSDALPVNCSAYSANPDPSLQRPLCPRSPRTCECLTQSLACHGCGSTIGYMIVIPCARCTSSISTNPNRTTNGHRFVFHSSEISGTERHYITDEPGVAEAAPFPIYSASALHNGLLRNPPAFHARQSQTAASHPEYLPTPPLDMEDISSTSSSPTPSSFPFHQDTLAMDSPPANHYPLPISHSSDHLFTHYHPPPLAHHRSTSYGSDSSMPPLLDAVNSFGLPMEPVEVPALPPLRAGDVLYWHHLKHSGEIPGVTDDPLARRAQLPAKKRVVFDR